MTSLNCNIGFIGAGNMGEAFIGALLQSGLSTPDCLFASDISQDRLAYLQEKYGVKTLTDNVALFDRCDIIVLAVKPQVMEEAVSVLSDQPAETPPPTRKLVLSIAAGTPLRKLESLLYAKLTEAQSANLPIIRVMPNTPALVLSGMSAMSGNRFATGQDLGQARAILEAMGNVVEVPETDMDAVTAVSGSGPAYIFYLLEAMIEAGIKLGFDPETAVQLSLTTAKGAVRLMEVRNEAPEDLRRKVTSPGGTTEAALNVMEANDVKSHIVEGIIAAARRAAELSK